MGLCTSKCWPRIARRDDSRCINNAELIFFPEDGGYEIVDVPSDGWTYPEIQESSPDVTVRERVCAA